MILINGSRRYFENLKIRIEKRFSPNEIPTRKKAKPMSENYTIYLEIQQYMEDIH